MHGTVNKDLPMKNGFLLCAAGRHVIGRAALILVAASIALTLLIGNIGFQGDDWWILSFPYWNPFPQSLWEYAAASLRPVEGLYWIVLYEIFGFHRTPYLFSSIILQGLASVLMGICLSNVCPQRRDVMIWAIVLSFLLPTMSNLFYVLHTDNSRLSMALFWASVLCIQKSASGSWYKLISGVALYWLSVLSYENASLLIFSVPFFVVPSLVGTGKQWPNKGVPIRIALAIVIGFLGFLGLRFVVLSGGAVAHADMIPSFHQLLNYGQTLMLFLGAPFKELSTDTGSWLLGVSIASATLALIEWNAKYCLPFEGSPQKGYLRTELFVIATGAVVFILGATPYLLAGYSAVSGYTSQSRVYSSSSYGVAIVLAVLVSTNLSSRTLRYIPKLVGTVLIAVMAVFACDLRKDWQAAAVIRADLCKSLVENAPDVTDFSTLLFLDLQSYIGNRAVIFQGVDGLNQYVKMLYHNKTVQGYFLYSREHNDVGASDRTAIITPKGVSARGSAPSGPSPIDSIIMFKRQRSQLVILDSVSNEESVLDAQWIGITRIASRTERIASGQEKIQGHPGCLY